MSQKQIVLPENQFNNNENNYKQIQGVKFTKMHRNQFI